MKKEKKSKKVDKPSEIDKLAKEIANKEIQEKEKLVDAPELVVQEPEPKEIEVAEVKIEPVEIKKEKKLEKKKKADPEIVEIVEKEKVEIVLGPPTMKPEAAPIKSQEDTAKQPATNVAFDQLGGKSFYINDAYVIETFSLN